MRKYRWYIFVLVLALIGGYFIFGRGNGEARETLIIRAKDFVKEVSVSGKVTAVNDADLAFKQGGRIAKILVRVGDLVTTNQTLASLANNDEASVVEDARLALDNAKLELAKLTSPIDQRVEEGKLAKAREDGLAEATSVYSDLFSILDGLDQILFDSDFNNSFNRDNLAYYVDAVDGYDSSLVSLLNTLPKAYRQAITDYNPAFTAYQTARRGSEIANIEKGILLTTSLVRDTLEITKQARDLVQFFNDRLLAGNSESIYKTTISQHLASLTSYFNTLNAHWLKLIDISNVINTQHNAITVSDLDLRTQKLEIDRRINNLRKAENSLADTYLRSPFTGTITRVDVKPGEIIAVGTSLFSIISADRLQIESFIPEIHVPFVKLGDLATITLDAYGPEVYFSAKVVSLDPAETIRDGVSTYRAILEFTAPDERVKSGLTANVTITALRKTNVISIPQNIVTTRAGQKFVSVKEREVATERPVTVGGISSFGEIEILSGLNEGEIVYVR